MNPVARRARRAPRLQGRRLPLAAQVRRRARHARRARRQARALRQPRAGRARRRHDHLRQRRAATRTTRSPRSARRAARPRSSTRSAPGSCSRSRRRSARTRSGGARTTSSAARSTPGAGTREHRASSATRSSTRLAIVSLGVRHRARPAALALRRRRAQRPVRHPGARRLLLRRPVHAPDVPDRRRVVGATWTPRSCAATWARSSSFVRAQLQLLHRASRRRLHASRPCTWSPTTAGSSCRCTASTRTPGLAPRERAAAAAADAPRRLVRVRRARVPRPARDRAGERARRLPRGGARLFAELEASPPDEQVRDPTLTPAFERIRWFPLPGEALDALREQRLGRRLERPAAPLRAAARAARGRPRP